MICIVVDSNILFSFEKDYTKAIFRNRLQDLIDEMESNDIYEEVKILIPHTVFEELHSIQCRDYLTAMDDFSKYKLPNFDCCPVSEPIVFFRELFDKDLGFLRASSIPIEIMPTPSDCKLQRLIARALAKKPPFAGREKQSDKGFKDALIWEALLEYKENHISDIMILYSNDVLLCDNSLKIEFNTLFHDIVYLVQKPNNKNDNDNAALLSVLGKILNKETKPSFATNMENRINDIFSQNNSIFYELICSDLSREDDSLWQIIKFDVLSTNIISRTEEIIDRRIFYVIEVKFNFFADNNDLAYHFVGSDQIRAFHIYYDFDSDDFYLTEYDQANSGRCVLIRPQSLSKEVE